MTWDDPLGDLRRFIAACEEQYRNPSPTPACPPGRCDVGDGPPLQARHDLRAAAAQPGRTPSETETTMTGSFSDYDPTFALWEQDNPGWFSCGLDALDAVCSEGRQFTTWDVWQRWRGPEPEEGRNMAQVMAEGVKLGWCRIVGHSSTHKRRDGHAGLGHVYEPTRPSEG